jgi:hypothetical protein
MDSPVPTKFDTAIVAPVNEALDAARNGDLPAAMLRLKIDPAKLPPTAFGQQVQALDRALDYINRGETVLAAPDFAACSPLIEAVGLPDVADFLAILRDLANGYALRIGGDAAGAVRLFENVMARADRLKFTFSNINFFSMQGKVGANLARVSIAFSLGDIDQAEKYAGIVQETYREMEQAAGAAGTAAPATVVEALVPIIEYAVAFAEVDANSLDYGSAQRRLKAASDAVERVSATLPALDKGAIANYVTTTLSVYHAMEKLVAAAASVVGKRDEVSSEALRGLDQVYDLLFDAQRNGNQAGPTAGGMLQMIRRLRRLADNLTAIARPKWRLADRIEGLVFGVSLVVLMAIEYSFVRPDPASWIQWMLGDLIAALIIGFGPNALQFMPMLQLWSGVKDKAKAG